MGRLASPRSGQDWERNASQQTRRLVLSERLAAERRYRPRTGALMVDPIHAMRLERAKRIGVIADEHWRYYARRAGLDPYAVNGSPLSAIAVRQVEIESKENHR